MAWLGFARTPRNLLGSVVNHMSDTRPSDKSIDLRGTACPYNYVKARLQLEMMEIGQVLEVFVDDGEPRTHVPSSLKRDGQKILGIEDEGRGVRIRIEKVTDV